MSNRPVPTSDLDAPGGQTGTPAPPRLGHRAELDGLRGIGVVLVMVSHSFWLTPRVAEIFPHGTFQMVDMFFVLSGFLLTVLLLEERQRTGWFSFGAFYQRRAMRLLPGVTVVLTAYVVFMWLSGQPMVPAWQSVAVVAGYVANYASAITDQRLPTLDLAQTWSLSVEEQYYLVFFPFLVALLRWVRRVPVIIGILAAVGISSWMWRLYALHAQGASLPAMNAAYVRTDMRFDVLVVGPILGLLFHRGLRRRRVLLGVGALAGFGYIVAFLFAATLQSPWVFQWGLTASGVSWTLIVAWLMTTPPGSVHRWLRSAVTVWLGRISYELYLWHMPVFVGVATVWGQGIRPLLAAVVTSVAAAAFTFHVLVRPFRRMRQRQGARVRGETRPPRPV